jgi:Uma2 family endonuclease
LWVEPKRYLDRHPLPDEVFLGIEVSESSLNYDRNEKAVLYAEAGMVEYWVVDITGKGIFTYSGPSGGKFMIQHRHGIDDTISPARFPQAGLSISDLFSPM